MTWMLAQADARALPLADDSVDLIVCSPPYWGLRSYRDGGEHYDGQIGSEDTPAQFVDELVGMIDGEWRRVLKPVGSLWLNLGDKYAGSGGPGTVTSYLKSPQQDRTGFAGQYPKGVEAARPKSLLGLPWRVALALIDRGWILRAEVIWSKPNGLPESVTDRVRRSHETWFHFTLEAQYFSAVDEIREEYRTDLTREPPIGGTRITDETDNRYSGNTPERAGLGRLPGSVWTIPTEPLNIPETTRQHLGLVDHFAAFPSEWPRRLILGWSPKGGTVLDPMCGTGTTPSVAHWLGRHGIGTDLSADYLKLARWRIEIGYDANKTLQRTHRDRQGQLL